MSKRITRKDKIDRKSIGECVPIREKTLKIKEEEAEFFKKKVMNMLDKEQTEAMVKISECPLVLVTGSYGTGKSYLVAAWSLLALKTKKIDKIYITKPVFTKKSEDLGFLKGDLVDKITPHLLPILQAFETFIPKAELEYYLEHGQIEMIPTMFLRGCNIGRPNQREVLITEEIQNLDREGTEKVVSRISENGKILLLGDKNQTDCKLSDSGLRDIVQFESPHFAKINLTQIHRHSIVKEIRDFYENLKAKEGRNN